MKNNILKISFAVWIALWVLFTAREIFVKNNIADYKVLLSRSLDGKKSYVTGDKLYGFLMFCNNKLPAGSSYMWPKTDKEDLDRRRATYYLYPNIESENAEYVLVYGDADFVKAGYKVFARLDGANYILRKGN